MALSPMDRIDRANPRSRDRPGDLEEAQATGDQGKFIVGKKPKMGRDEF